MSDARQRAEDTRQEAQWALDSFDAEKGRRDFHATELAHHLRALLAEQDGAVAKQDDCLCRCPETPGTHTATRCWDPAPSPASDEVRERLMRAEEAAEVRRLLPTWITKDTSDWQFRCAVETLLAALDPRRRG